MYYIIRINFAFSRALRNLRPFLRERLWGDLEHSKTLMTSSQTLDVDFTTRYSDGTTRTTRICKPSISSACSNSILRLRTRASSSSSVSRKTRPAIDFMACTRVCPSNTFATRASSSNEPFALFGENSR